MEIHSYIPSRTQIFMRISDKRDYTNRFVSNSTLFVPWFYGFNARLKNYSVLNTIEDHTDLTLLFCVDKKETKKQLSFLLMRSKAKAATYRLFCVCLSHQSQDRKRAQLCVPLCSTLV